VRKTEARGQLLLSQHREMFLERLKSVSVRLMLPVVVLALAGVGRGYGQTCLTASDMDDATKTALVSTAQSFFGMVFGRAAAELDLGAGDELLWY
jgi:hypothetical protein